MQNNVSEVIGISAEKGWGKTAYMTYNLYQDHLAGAKIITNYSTKFSDIIATTEEIMDMILEESHELENACIGLDELHQGADARHFQSSSNEAFNLFFTQLRKRNIIMYYTIQFNGQIDKRIRKLTNFVVNISPDPLTYGRENFMYEKNPKVFFWVLRDPKSWKPLAKAVWNAEKFFEKELYDTREIVTFSKNSLSKAKEKEFEDIEKEEKEDDNTKRNKSESKPKAKRTKSKVSKKQPKE